MHECKGLTNQLYIDVNGFYSPCCMMTGRANRKLVISSTPENWINSTNMTSLVDKLHIGDWPAGCKMCKLAEEENRESFREIYNREYTQESGTIESFLLNTRNQCNIRCRMCGPEYSDKWAKTIKIIPVASTITFRSQYEKIKHLIGPDFKYLKIAGGEPLLYPDVFEVIELILEKNPNVDVQINTNVTFFPKKYLHVFDKIKTLRPIYSIDGIGLVNDYIRQDSNWDSTVKVLNQWTSYMNSRSSSTDEQFFQTTVQAYNFHDKHNIKNLMDSLGCKWIRQSIYYPYEFALNALPPEYIQKHTNEANKNFVAKYKFDEKLFAQLKTRTSEDDKLLGKNIQDYIPELYELLNS